MNAVFRAEHSRARCSADRTCVSSSFNERGKLILFSVKSLFEFPKHVAVPQPEREFIGTGTSAYGIAHRH